MGLGIEADLILSSLVSFLHLFVLGERVENVVWFECVVFVVVVVVVGYLHCVSLALVPYSLYPSTHQSLNPECLINHKKRKIPYPIQELLAHALIRNCYVNQNSRLTLTASAKLPVSHFVNLKLSCRTS